MMEEERNEKRLDHFDNNLLFDAHSLWADSGRNRGQYRQSGEMKEHIVQYGTVLENWFPLGGRGNTQILFNDEIIKSIADAHGVSSAQVIIRWHLQAGNICIPGSSNEQHIIEDYDV